MDIRDLLTEATDLAALVIMVSGVVSLNHISERLSHVETGHRSKSGIDLGTFVSHSHTNKTSSGARNLVWACWQTEPDVE